MKKNQIRSSLLLLFATIIWGTAFVTQITGMKDVGPFTFNAVRSLLAALFLGLLILGRKFIIINKNSAPVNKIPYQRKKLIKASLICGVIIAVATGLQQLGISKGVTAGKAGFITSLYIVMVPIFGLFIGKKVMANIWAGAALSLAGMYLLCAGKTNSISRGDIYIFICAVLYSVHILLIDRYSPDVDPIKLSCNQFLISGILNSIPMLIFEKPAIASIGSAWFSIAFTGILSSGVAFTIQVYCQKDLHPAVASIIMSMESAIALLAGWVFLKQGLSTTETIGCIFAFLGVLIAQANLFIKNKKQKINDPISTEAQPIN